MKRKVLTVDEILTKKGVWDTLERARETARNAEGIIIFMVHSDKYEHITSMDLYQNVYYLELLKNSLLQGGTNNAL